MTEQHRYAVAYDVSDDGLRERVRRACRAYGGRQQYSLFEMYLSQHERAELVARLRELVDSAEDYATVKLYSIGPPEHDTTLGDATDEEAANVV